MSPRASWSVSAAYLATDVADLRTDAAYDTEAQS
jgi:hypothetical protein